MTFCLNRTAMGTLVPMTVWHCICFYEGMKQPFKKRNSNAIKQVAGLAGGLILVGAVAYWFFRRPQGAKLLKDQFRSAGLKNSKHKYGDGTRDAIDQAGWESFPASDPPAYSGFH